jgi:hypothetical protein
MGERLKARGAHFYFRSDLSVIASVAKQSSLNVISGLLRRPCGAPRNDA